MMEMGVDIIWWIMGAGLIVYVVTGGADFGGGVWDLLSHGPDQKEERRIIENAISPIWEVNHIWVIFLLVMMFSIFPVAFAAISIALHIPITLAVIGIILRGACFTFRGYGLQPDETRQRWGMIFAWASLITPIFLGVTLAATSTGDILVERVMKNGIEFSVVTTGYFAGWTTPFAIATGVLALVIFTMTAAVYLVHEVDGHLKEKFRRRAAKTQIVMLVMLAVVYALAHRDAAIFAEQLDNSSLIWPLRIFIAASAAGIFWTLKEKLDDAARFAVILQVSAVVLGWGLAMGRYLIIPDVTIDQAGSRTETLAAVLPVLAGGAIFLIPSLYMLFKIFKSPVKEVSNTPADQ